MDNMGNQLSTSMRTRGKQIGSKGGMDKQPTKQADKKKKIPREVKDVSARELSSLMGRSGKQITKAKTLMPLRKSKS
ncbi:hypothetical protein [Helicobacter bizzozeronii]|nr:hypothetical protein [Helicobacter bizzozeronii]